MRRRLLPSRAKDMSIANKTKSLCNGTTDNNVTSTIAKRDSYGISVTSVGIRDGAITSQISLGQISLIAWPWKAAAEVTREFAAVRRRLGRNESASQARRRLEIRR
jgi:hypothetical protein